MDNHEGSGRIQGGQRTATHEPERAVTVAAQDSADHGYEPAVAISDEECERNREELDREREENWSRDVAAEAEGMTPEQAQKVLDDEYERSTHARGCNLDAMSCASCSAEEGMGWGEAESRLITLYAARGVLAQQDPAVPEVGQRADVEANAAESDPGGSGERSSGWAWIATASLEEDVDWSLEDDLGY